MPERDDDVFTTAQFVMESVANESLRTTQIVAALESADVPFDSMTAVALDVLARHLSCALEAEEQQKIIGPTP